MLKNYFKIAFRNLLRHKGFSLINLSGLSIGLAVCLLIGLYVHDELQYDKGINDGHRIYRVYNERSINDVDESTPRTPPMYAPSLKQELPEVEYSLRVMEILSKDLFVDGDKKIYEVGGVFVESSFFDLFPLPMKFGSTEKVLDDPTSIIISEEMSQRFFENENPVGKEIFFQNEPYLVKGVIQRNESRFHLKINYILPLSVAQIPDDRLDSWQWNQFNTYIKLEEGADYKVVQSKFQDLVQQKTAQFRGESNDVTIPYFQPLSEIYLHSADFKMDMANRGNIIYVKALVIIAIFILLIACFNFVNLATAKSLLRAKEVGVRKSIGASRKNLIVQFIGETTLLTFLSVSFATIISALFLPALNQFTGKQISFDIYISPVFILILLILVFVTGIIAGLYPAFVLSGFKPVKVLKGTIIRDGNPGSVPWLRHGLVVVQFSLSIFLIISALVVYKQVQFLHNKDLGFNREEIMFFPMRGNEMFGNYETFKNELLAKPGVTSVSIGYGFPGDIFAGDGIFVPGQEENKRYSVTQLLVDHDYIKTLGIHLVAGRDFSKEFTTDPDKAFIINEEAVKQLGFETPENAIGQKLEWNVWNNDNPDSLKRGEVIGVVKDFHYKSLFDMVEPTVLQIYPPAYWKVAVKLETNDLAYTISQVENVWSGFSPDYPLEFKFMDENFEQMYKAEDKLKVLLWIFTGMAIFVGCLGLFGLAAYVAESRKKEIGIRKVLGAVTSSIVSLLSVEFLKLVLIAAIIAFPFAWLAMQHWLEDFAYRIDIPLWIFFFSGLLAAIIAFLTISIQAIKAAMDNPVKNLRTE